MVKEILSIKKYGEFFNINIFDLNDEMMEAKNDCHTFCSSATADVISFVLIAMMIVSSRLRTCTMSGLVVGTLISC